MDKLAVFIKEKDGKIFYLRPVSESATKIVKENIEADVRFDGFESDDDDDVIEENVSSEPELKYYSQQKHVVEKVTSEYIANICENLQEPFKDSEMMKNFQVLVPKTLNQQEKIAQFGQIEIKEIIEHYSDQFGLDKELVCLNTSSIRD